MAQTYYAQVYEGIVNRVIAADKDFVDHWDDGLPGEWLLTDYYTVGNVHYNTNWQPDGGTPFRGNYAGVGFTYDNVNDVFIAPKPYKNAVLDPNTWTWVPPVDSLPTIHTVTPVINGCLVDYLAPPVPPEGGIAGWVYMITHAMGEYQNPFDYPLVIEGLEGGTPYTVNVGYLDNQGNTFWSVQPESFIPLTAQPPAITSATPADASATITWATAPNQGDVLPPVPGQVFWKIGYKPETSSDDYIWVDSINEEPEFTLTGLTNGTKYAVAVIDVVNDFASEPSQPFYVTPAA